MCANRSPKTQGKGEAEGCAGAHLLWEGSLLILQAPKGGIREALEQGALAAPGALGKGQRHRRYGSCHRQHRAHACALRG